MKTKKRFHKLTAWLLTLAMLMTFIPSFTLTASATTEVYASGNLGQGNRTAWTIYDNGLLVIDGKGNSISTKWDSTTASPWKDYADIITRASFVNCENWVCIPENTFRGLSNLKEVIFPENIEEICQYAFTGAALETIILPERLETIGNYAFSSCESLNYININDGVTSIGSSAFYNCSSLKAISIPDSVTSIGQTLFQNCGNLEYVRLSESLDKVGGSMFLGCTMLKNVSLPASVTVIGSKAFSNASNLAGVYYHGTVEPTTYNPGLNNASFSLTPDTMVIYASNDYSGTTMGLKATWENDVHNVTKIDGYFVNVAHTIGGAVKVDKSIVPVGDTVTVDIMAYKNYVLDTFAVTGADGNEITVTGDSNTRTFSMPEGDVTITATFKSTIVPHVHSWTFEAEGTYINATCANTDGACHNPYQSVVITPPSTKYFAWNLERTVTVSGTIEDVEIPEVVYTLKSTGEEVRPFEPGVYVASLTIENTTLTYEYEITKSNQLNNSFFTYTAPENLTYDGTAKIATVVPNATVDAYIGDVEVLYNSSSTPPATVGTYTVTLNVEESDYFTAKTNLALGGRGGQKFSIVAKDIEDLDYTGLAASYPVGATPDVTIQYNGMTLEKDTDYTLEYANNTVPGTATITVTGIGNYTGTKTLEFEISAHIHSWNYELDGADTIKATCTAEGCTDTNGGSVTIAAPASLDYTGEAIEAVVTNNLTTGDTVEVVYTAVSGSELTEGKPVKVGTYTAKITIGGVTASVDFEITPVIYTVTLTDDGNGTGTANPASGAEGTEVTLTANPKEGYKFKEWQVTPNTVTVENNRFTMPAGNVTAKAIFEAIPPTITAVYKSGTTHYIEWTASVSAGTGRTLTSVTVNGYELLDEENATTKNASVEIRYGGKYTFAVTDSTGNTASVELDIDIPVTFPADSITVVDNWSADKLYHRGEAIIDSSKLSGGAYDPSKITADGGAALAPKDYTGGYGYFQMVVNGVPEDFNIETGIIPWFEDIMWRDVTEGPVGALKTANHIIVLQSLFDKLNPDLIAWQFITVRDNKIKIESMSNSDMLNNQPGSITATFTGGHTGRYEVAILSGDGLTADAFKDSAVVWQLADNGTITLDGLIDGTYRIAVRAKYEEADAYRSVNSNYWHGLVISDPVVIRSVYPITLEAVPAAGGSITASVESAENNEEFDVTIAVEDGYAIQGLYYVDDDGSEVAFTTSDYSSIQTAGTHTIRMPKRGATTIRVKFAPKVIFKDWDYTILSEQYVSYGSAATAPQNPARENWKFIGWDKAFDNVTEPLTVMAKYEEKIVVSVPDIASKVYNGSVQTATVPESEYYTVKANNGGINAGEYDVVLELTDSEGYRWNTTNEKTVSMKFNITKAQAVISVDVTPIVKTYGEALTLPTATTNFGTVSADKTVADMKNAGEYTVTYTVAGNDNYNGDTKTVSVTINPKKIDKPSADNTSFVYDGNEQTYNVAASDYYSVTGNKRTDAGSQDVIVALNDKTNYAWNDGKTDDVTFTFTIAKKDITGATVGAFTELTYTGGVQTPFATVTIDGLTVTGTWSDVTNVADKTTFTANGNFTGTIADKETGMLKANSSVATVPGANALTYSETAQELVIAGVANGGTLKYSFDNTTWVDAIPTGTNADTYEVWYKVFGDANHSDTDSVKVDVTIAKKSIEAATIALDGALTYDGAEQTQNVTVTLDGFTVTFDVTDNKATNVKADGNYTLKVTANGNFTGEKTLEWNIAKADHIIEGENIPTASRIRRGNKLSTSTITPAELKDADGNVLGTFTWVTPDDEMTETGDFVKQVKFTPTDTTNYNEKTFDVTVNVYRPSSGGGGSSNTTTTTTKNEDGSTTKVTENKTTGTKTEVTTNTDGSTTTVETKKDGTVTTTEKDKDGNTTTTVEKSDGTSTTTEKNKDGSEKVTEEKADGTTVTTEKDTDGTKTVTTENADGSKTTEEVRKDGTEVKTETTTDGETTAEVVAKGETEVVIPAPDAEEVYEVVVTDENGNETVITDFKVVNGGVAVTVDGNAYISISKGFKKEFVDVHHVDHWSEESVDYVYIRGLMMGTSENHFSPDVPLTRAMLVTVLYRLEGEPEMKNAQWFEDVEKGQWYSDAVAWATFNGITMGYGNGNFGPNDNITREQIVAIMHRYAQYKGYDVTQGGMLIREYSDYENISDYALNAMTWSVNIGMLSGRGNNNLAPQSYATRAEVAAILERFIKAN